MIDFFVGLLPLFSLGLLVFGTRWDHREGIVTASLIWSLLAVFSLEILGHFGLINFWTLASFWTVSAIAIGLTIARLHSYSAPAQSAPHDVFFTSTTAVVAGIVLVTLAIGLLSAPNTADSLRYHLPRIEQWIQQSSLANFPTIDNRQLASGPLAEMLILHFRLLSASDYLDNLVQGLAFAGSVWTSAIVARHLGAGRPGQVLAAVLVATLPMAILQGSSTQNDFVVSFFLLAAVERLLAWHASGRLLHGMEVGIATGLAVLVKGTAFFYAVPLGLGVLAVLLHRRRWVQLGVAALMVILILLINAPHLYRNARVILAPVGLVSITASLDRSPGAAASSVLRNAASNFVTPWNSVNETMIHAIAKVHKVIGRDVDDPNTTLRGTRFWDLPRNVLNGDVAPNPLHLLLVLLATGLAVIELFSPPATTGWMPKICLLGAVIGGVLFCTLLRWQPFIVRLQLPFFILAAPAAGVILAAWFGQRGLIIGTSLLLVAALPFVICNQERPLYGNPARAFANHFAPNILSASYWQIMFWDNPHKQQAYERAVESVRDRAQGGVGLIPYYDYVFWRMLKGKNFSNAVHIENVCVDAAYEKSNRYQPSNFQPAVILTDLQQPAVLRCTNGTFERESSFATGDLPPTSQVSVYRRRSD